MNSPQSVVSPLKNSVVVAESENQKTNFLNNGSEVNTKEAVWSQKDNNILGVLEVYVHQARDIHNICIYHKQDVYAKLCLTSDPESTVSTKIINGGGRDPVFNDNLRLDVRNAGSSLKIEIFMMSRVRNYLEDQLLGFALVPLSEVILKNGKLEKEFSLSSTDLFHSPAGFVQLSLAYAGSSPDVMTIPDVVADETVKDLEASEFEKIEFPDPKIMNENEMMVSEYFGMTSSNLDSESLANSDAESSKIGVNVIENFSTATLDSIQVPNRDSPLSSVSTNGVSLPSPSAAASSESFGDTSKTSNQEQTSAWKEKTRDGDNDSSGAKPVVSVHYEPEMKMVQQDIVDMYMKSMQQFTESLAKMKLPLDMDSNGPTKSEDSNTSSDQKTPGSKNNSGSRVFYGSRAFF